MAEIWELQQLSLYRICNIYRLEKLSKIWKMIAPLDMEKSRAAIDIASIYKSRKLRYKYPQISHTAAGFIINLVFYI